tara:strand:- start:1974 stop:2279 length:306 start_codon:yes stop_codon:yes gene_type:complete
MIKTSCINPWFFAVVLFVFFIIFKYYSFLPGRHYKNGHFLALINDEDVRVLHSMGYGLDQNKNQLYSKEGLPMFEQGSYIYNYEPYNTTGMLNKMGIEKKE